ncbi:plastocyanin [Anthocerotibacter panamensis]|uniref:plastocyanin n=1 Tax=Anthocerotibacter panamensis TaxID=2857077 RepID=UPI001C40553A|nr:plastocyanin [Anthocerotibacter panamensis]
MVRQLRFVLTGGLLVLLVACGGGPQPEQTTTTSPQPPAPPEPTTTSQAPSSPTPADGTEVKMGSDKGQLIFAPNKLTVKPGDKIKWVMNKAGPHNVIFPAEGSPDPASAQAMTQKKLLSKPGNFYITTVPQAQPGTYTFYCQPHKGAGMVGTLTVVGTATTAPQK